MVLAPGHRSQKHRWSLTVCRLSVRVRPAVMDWNEWKSFIGRVGKTSSAAMPARSGIASGNVDEPTPDNSDHRPFDSRGVAPQDSNISTLRLKPAESGDPASATGVIPASSINRFRPSRLVDHFQGDNRHSSGKLSAARTPHRDESRKGHF